MATYRNVQMSFWTDPKISDDFTPEDKYFYLYLLTNPHTNISGCYELSIRQMSIETGYSKDSVMKLLERMEKVHSVIQYSNQYKEVLIFNWSLYNWTSSPLLKRSIEDSIEKLKTPEFKAFVRACYESKDTLSHGYIYQQKKTFCLGYVLDINTSKINSIENEPQKEDEEREKRRLHQQEVEQLFESVWKLYLRKEGKNQVSKTTKEELYKVGYDKLKACIEKYAREKVGCDKKYILMGSTFFNGRYKDYLEEEKETVNEDNGQLKRVLQ